MCSAPVPRFSRRSRQPTKYFRGRPVLTGLPLMFGPQHPRTLSLSPFPCLRAVRTSLDESAPPHPALRLTSSACRLRSVLLGILLPNEREVRAVCLTVPLWLRSSLAPDGGVSVYCFRFYPLHWTLLRDNSCARQLHVFCFSGSSQQIF
jgi:hypothetical protein